MKPMATEVAISRPTCWIIAGPNGAGKTTFAMEFLPRAGCMHFINADLIAAGLAPLAPERELLAASRLVLSGDNTYRGVTNIVSGFLQAAGNTALGAASGTAGAGRNRLR